MLTETPFRILDLAFEARLAQPIEWPGFAGSLLRGVFGASLRHISCMTGYRTCLDCPLLRTCPYPLLFEPPPRDLSAVGIQRTQQGLPPPFVLIVPPNGCGPGADVRFGMRLFGPAIERIAIVIEAWRRAIARGIGRDRTSGRLASVSDEQSGALLYDGELLLPVEAGARPLEAAGSALEIRTRSPLRFQARGNRLPVDGLTPRRLIADIVRRARMLACGASDAVQAEVADWPVDAWLDAADSVRHSHTLVWRDWRRYSARQGQIVNLGGYVGTWNWWDVPVEIQKLLALGSVLHVGKDASFGLGAYSILPSPPMTQSESASSSERRLSPSMM